MESTANLTELDRLEREFSGWQTTVQTPEFQQWLGRTPSRRTVGTRAAQGDISAARMLLEDYNDFVSATKPHEDKNDNKSSAASAVRKVATERSGGSEQLQSGKIITRADVVAMITNDPDRYYTDAFQNELKAAIRDGRFRA